MTKSERNIFIQHNGSNTVWLVTPEEYIELEKNGDYNSINPLEGGVLLAGARPGWQKKAHDIYATRTIERVMSEVEWIPAGDRCAPKYSTADFELIKIYSEEDLFRYSR